MRLRAEGCGTYGDRGVERGDAEAKGADPVARPGELALRCRVDERFGVGRGGEAQIVVCDFEQRFGCGGVEGVR